VFQDISLLILVWSRAVRSRSGISAPDFAEEKRKHYENQQAVAETTYYRHFSRICSSWGTEDYFQKVEATSDILETDQTAVQSFFELHPSG
jgi:hypothetical protein